MGSYSINVVADRGYAQPVRTIIKFPGRMHIRVEVNAEWEEAVLLSIVLLPDI